MQFSLPVKPYRKSPTSNKVEFKLQATDISRMPFCPLIHLHKIYRNLVAFQNTAKLKMCRRDYTAGFANPKEDRWWQEKSQCCCPISNISYFLRKTQKSFDFM